MKYSEKLKDPRWQKKRLEIMEKDNFKCRDCGDSQNTLSVHHCHYEKGDPWDTDSEFLMTLCDDCHATRQLFEDRAREHLGRMFASLTQKQVSDLAYNFAQVAEMRSMIDCSPERVLKDGTKDCWFRGMETPILIEGHNR